MVLFEIFFFLQKKNDPWKVRKNRLDIEDPKHLQKKTSLEKSLNDERSAAEGGEMSILRQQLINANKESQLAIHYPPSRDEKIRVQHNEGGPTLPSRSIPGQQENTKHISRGLRNGYRFDSKVSRRCLKLNFIK